MSNVVWKETRKRGPVSWGFLVLFFTFNVLMLAVTAIYWAGVVRSGDAALRSGVGAILGNVMGAGIVMAIWVSGAIILALLTLMTQSQVTLVEEVELTT